MKKYIIYYLIFIPSLLSGQWIDSTSRWKEVYSNSSLSSNKEYYDIHITGDTIINSLKYFKLWKSGIDSVIPLSGSSYVDTINGYVAAIREDTANKKIYVKFNKSPNEELLYDFNLKSGDLVHSILAVTNCSLKPAYITKIDTVYLGAQPRKRFFVGNPQGSQYLIEGIGANTGLFGDYCLWYHSSSCMISHHRSADSLVINGCKRVPFTQNPPKAKFTCKVDSISPYGECCIKFIDQSTDTALTWRWDFGFGGPYSTLQNPVQCYFMKAKYDICLYVTNYAGADTLCIKSYVIVDSTGCHCPDDSILIGLAEKISRAMEFEIFPIPFNESLSIKVPENFKQGDLFFRLTNVMGEEIVKYEIKAKENQVYLERISPGIYIYSLESKTSLLKRGKIIKQ